MKTISLLFTLIITCGSIEAQIKFAQVSLRTLSQLDFQKADFNSASFPFEFKEHKNTSANFGLDVLIEKSITKKLSIYGGVGYFRNRFNFQRRYDHVLLNFGRDSVPIGTSTRNYDFLLLRIPVGIIYNISAAKKVALSIGIENIINFSFKQIYNGTKPFPEANNEYTKFNYYGNSVLVFLQVSKDFSNKSSFHFSHISGY
jgi:hypothetical protein